MSKRDDALGALHARLAAALAFRDPAPLVLRDETTPQRLPAGGLVVVRDGGQVESIAILSPLSWAVEHRAEVEVVADSAALLDALLVDIGAAVLADRTLGGAVEWAQPGPPDFEEVEFEGAASVPVSLVLHRGGLAARIRGPPHATRHRRQRAPADDPGGRLPPRPAATGSACPSSPATSAPSSGCSTPT